MIAVRDGDGVERHASFFRRQEPPMAKPEPNTQPQPQGNTMNNEDKNQAPPAFSADEMAAVRGSLATLLENARSDLSIGDGYLAKARATATTASVLLRSVGVRKSPDDVLAALASREGVFVAEDYAKLAANELLPEAAKEGEAENA